MNTRNISIVPFIFILLFHTGCKKLVTIDPPISSITTTEAFSTDAQANSVMAGVYTTMINGTNLTNASIYNSFAAGLATLTGSYSSDELQIFGGTISYITNHLTGTDNYYGGLLWSSAYNTIYGANSVIEGIAASTSGQLKDSTRKELTAEAKFLRAFSYSYLINFFGDVPLVLTVDFNKTVSLKKSPKEEVWQQVMQDLKDAQAVLPADFSYSNGERIIANKGAATALLARVYLTTGNYAGAAEQAGILINDAGRYSLVSDLNGVFLKNSKETIWQLQQNPLIVANGNATSEGLQFIPTPEPHTGFPTVNMTQQLLSSFEPGDQRLLAWVDSTDASAYGPSPGIFYFPYKYKTGYYNKVYNAPATEYYTVMRLAEQYLIRAEAEAKGAPGGAGAAIADLNAVRNRAGLADLPGTLTADELWTAIAHERQTELFCEWGHRWMDLRRMGLAHDVLSAISYKQPWAGDYQFLYPVPLNEIITDHFITQNPGY